MASQLALALGGVAPAATAEMVNAQERQAFVDVLIVKLKEKDLDVIAAGNFPYRRNAIAVVQVLGFAISRK